MCPSRPALVAARLVLGLGAGDAISGPDPSLRRHRSQLARHARRPSQCLAGGAALVWATC
eukprot:5158070-Alexandrium_andersonii.AAC.1